MTTPELNPAQLLINELIAQRNQALNDLARTRADTVLTQAQMTQTIRDLQDQLNNMLENHEAQTAMVEELRNAWNESQQREAELRLLNLNLQGTLEEIFTAHPELRTAEDVEPPKQ